MGGRVVPLVAKGEQSPLARYDRVAVELIATGRAINLQTARLDLVLGDLREQRDRLAGVIAELRGQEPTGHEQADVPRERLLAALGHGLVQLDLFIARARVLVELAEPSATDSPESAPQSAPTG